MEHFFIIIIQITCLSRSNEKIAAPPARRPAGAPRAPGRLPRALRGGPAVSSFPGARAPGYFSLALCKQDNLPRPKGAQITIVSQTNIRHTKPPEAGEGPLSRRGVRQVRGAQSCQDRRRCCAPVRGCQRAVPAPCSRKGDPGKSFP